MEAAATFIENENLLCDLKSFCRGLYHFGQEILIWVLRGGLTPKILGNLMSKIISEF